MLKLRSRQECRDERAFSLPGSRRQALRPAARLSRRSGPCPVSKPEVAGGRCRQAHQAREHRPSCAGHRAPGICEHHAPEPACRGASNHRFQVESNMSSDRHGLLTGARILVVDDVDSDRNLLAHYLQRQGCRTYVGLDGEEDVQPRVQRLDLGEARTRELLGGQLAGGHDGAGQQGCGHGGEAEVRLQPYVLPHHSRLSASEYDYYQDRSDFISNQGGYVYRNGRLMAWGDWFRLVPKGEATKLARVQIDFPNSLDEAWTIDIKKSRARPPHAVRERLRQIINRITARSVTVHRGRGQKLFQESQAPFWERYADHGGIRFAINEQHPLIASLGTRLSSEDVDLLRVLLDSIAASLPVEMIYSDYSTHPREINQRAVDESQTLERLKSLRKVLYGDGPGDPNAFLQIVRSTHLFDGQIELAEKFISEAFA